MRGLDFYHFGALPLDFLRSLRHVTGMANARRLWCCESLHRCLFIGMRDLPLQGLHSLNGATVEDGHSCGWGASFNDGPLCCQWPYCSSLVPGVLYLPIRVHHRWWGDGKSHKVQGICFTNEGLIHEWKSIRNNTRQLKTHMSINVFKFKRLLTKSWEDRFWCPIL